MRQPYRKRKIHTPPLFHSFKPVGVPRRVLKQIVLTLDEYEALRLGYYVNLDHLEASKFMCISRPTFTRLIEKARSKMTQALVEGCELVIQGGNIAFVNNLHRCRECGHIYAAPVNIPAGTCPECGTGKTENLADKVTID